MDFWVKGRISGYRVRMSRESYDPRWFEWRTARSQRGDKSKVLRMHWLQFKIFFSIKRMTWYKVQFGQGLQVCLKKANPLLKDWNTCNILLIFVYLFGVFSLIWWPHRYRWRAAKFNLFSALMAIERWCLFSVPLLLWHSYPLYPLSVYNSHLRGPVTLTPITEHLAAELSLPVLTT